MYCKKLLRSKRYLILAVQMLCVNMSIEEHIFDKYVKIN
jgi:hypothetical protein